MNCLICRNATAAGCDACNPTTESHETWLKKTITIDNPYQEQLDRIEAQNKEILALLQKKKRKPRASKRTYTVSFDYCWSKYPKRAGSNPKQRAEAAYEKRISEYDTEPNALAALHQGTIRYAKFCDATNKTGTEFVMQAATFFGPDKHYENGWIVPKQKKDPAAIESPSHDAVDFDKLRDAENELRTVERFK